MNLAVSNLAWDTTNELQIFKHLNSFGINKIEGVLSKLGNWDTIDSKKIVEYKNYLNSNSIEINSLQSIFYNTGINDIKETNKIISHIEKLISLSEILGVNVLVFGSPNLRKTFNGIDEYLVELFYKIDSLLINTDIELSIEPNMKEYGGDFFTKIKDIVSFIEDNNFKKIKTMIDTHNLDGEGDDICKCFIKHKNLINHIHVSEKKLSPISSNDNHILFSNELKNSKYSGIITYEVFPNDLLIGSIETFKRIYF
jgi:sugar phosphate isomerase/epimerase